MKAVFISICLLVAAFPGRGQDSVVARMIFIGDAGEINPAQSSLIPDAAKAVLPGKTTVVFLGDNIYPRGMALPGSGHDAETEAILRSQFAPMRSAGAAVYFVPGNHDWDRMGPEGLAKVRAAWAFLQRQGDSLLRQVPPDGCPDPVVIPVSDSVVIVAMDSEWWLFPFDKADPGADCACTSPRDVTDALREIAYRHRDQTILLAMHHPFYSYGVHGGYFTWKDHLFPLTNVSPHLYIPLPLIGSIYPLYRRIFPNPEELRNPLYKEMIKDVEKVFRDHPNVVLVSGHDHGMQLITPPKGPRLQIVSGGGAKHNANRGGRYSLFHDATQGYVVADVHRDGDLHVVFHTYTDSILRTAYAYDWHREPPGTWKDSLYGAISGDSATVAAHPAYRSGAFGRWWFGENYRREWTTPVTLPVLRVSELHGGLKPVKLGGGFQSTSLRLEDSAGTEYTLRSVEKSPDKVLPKPFQGTFLRELIDDATSAQHPYSALVVPSLAQALGVPHATPVIGVVAPDSSLGMYNGLFAGKVTLLEAREPAGETDNTEKTLEKLQEDNDNTYDAISFSKARMLDLLLGDWDRHGDQWRFHDRKDGKGKDYIAVPRDRDMALNRTEGVLPTIAKRFFLLPHVAGFREHMLPGSRYYLFKSRFLEAFPAGQIDYPTWMSVAHAFQQELTDSVLEGALRHLPADIYPLRHDELFRDLKQRRDDMGEAMDRYYRFTNRIVDIRASDKNELALVQASPDSNALVITLRKISKHGKLEDTLMSKAYPADLTREVRLYLSGGDDSVIVDNPSSTVGLRIIGGRGDKHYHVVRSRRRIRVYDRPGHAFSGETERLRLHLGRDSALTAFVPVNLYNTSIPLLTAALNADDGLSLGAGIQYVRQLGFRKSPYASVHQLMFSHSFSTSAYRLRYKSEWMQALGNADILLHADIKAPNNTQNYFGRGNETPFDKAGDYKRYYRTRFNLYEVEAALRWRGGKGSAFSLGPVLQYYRLDPDDNQGRLINRQELLHSYDSATVDRAKAHLGLRAEYVLDQRDDARLPAYGAFVRVVAEGFAGLNRAAASYGRVMPELALYKSLNVRKTLVLSDRLGGGFSLGRTTFYQSLFLGGEGNLLGYRKYRFAGQQSLYNNLELRLALTDFGNYIVRGQMGLTGFYDVGRVWQDGESSHVWHQGVGGGLYFAPAYMAVFSLVAGYSREGWYPYFTMGLRF